MFYQDPWFWMFVMMSLLAMVFWYLGFIRNPLPVPDWGMAGLIFQNEGQQKRYAGALKLVGVRPTRHTPEADVQRLMYTERLPLDLVVPLAEQRQKLGLPDAYVAVRVKSPITEAEKAQRLLEADGYTTCVIHDPDASLKKGLLSILSSGAFPGKAIVYRKHVLYFPTPPRIR